MENSHVKNVYSVHTDKAGFCRALEECTGNYTNNNVFYLFDENTYEHCRYIFSEMPVQPDGSNTFVLPSGETAKTIEYAEKVWSFLLDSGADRHSLLVNVGGGVVCDAGGFVASVFKRGIDFVHVPTTLLAMVDAAIGGKTGLNFNGLKNQLGTFTQPQKTVIFTGFLETLPQRELKSGLAEMYKHALISGGDHWEQLKNITSISSSISAELIRNSIAVKDSIVRKDFSEKAGRQVLNLGHTVGHALESTFSGKGDKSLLHGEAVANGLCIEALLSVKKGLLKEAKATEIVRAIQRFFPPVSISDDDLKVFEKALMADKKNKSGKIRFVLLKDAGNPETDIECTNKEVLNVIKTYTS